MKSGGRHLLSRALTERGRERQRGRKEERHIHRDRDKHTHAERDRERPKTFIKNFYVELVNYYLSTTSTDCRFEL